MTQDQYFTERPASASAPQQIEARILGHTLRFFTDTGVFSKDGIDHGTRVLLETADVHPGDEILDLGAGWGAIGVTLGAVRGALPTLIERNERAAGLCMENLRRHRVTGRVLVGDGFDVLSGERFAHILLNPPIRAGKRVYYPWLAAARTHLSPQGALWVVVRTGQGAKSLRAELVRLGAQVEDRAIEGGYRVYRATWP